MRASRVGHGVLVCALTVAMLSAVSARPAEAQASAGNTCSDVVILLDESGSMDGFESQVRVAVDGFLDVVADRGPSAAVIDFGTAAVRVFDYQPITSSSITAVFGPYLNATSGGLVYDAPSETGAYTNWDDALDEVTLLAAEDRPPTLVLFVTDGVPTAYNRDAAGEDGGITRSTTDPNALTRAVAEADEIKFLGSHILAVGVGGSVTANLSRLQAVSGPDVFDGTGELDAFVTDVALVPDFNDLADVLQAIAESFCPEPSIQVDKSAVEPTIVAGDEATYTITVTNTGLIDLVGVVVTDPQLPACDLVLGDLVVGDSVTYTCSTALFLDTTNTATATGTGTDGTPVEDESSAPVDVINPALDVQKTVDAPLVLPGQTVTFTISVHNVGDVPLTDVTVSDPAVPGCDRYVGALESTEEVTYTCSTVLTDSLINVAEATGTDPLGNPVSDSDDEPVVVIFPEIEIVKSAPATAPAGSAVPFEFAVTNIGDVDLTDVTVTDPLFPGCDRFIGDLAVGVTVTYTCEVVLFTSVTNVATATGEGPLGTPVDDDDNATVTVFADGTGTPGYWKNHAERLPVLGGTTIVGDWNHNWSCDPGEVCLELTTEEALAAPSTPPRGDFTYNLARALVTAWFNVSVGNDASCVADDIEAATAWLLVNPIGSGVKSGDAGEMTAIATRLDDYNNGRLCAEHRDSKEADSTTSLTGDVNASSTTPVLVEEPADEPAETETVPSDPAGDADSEAGADTGADDHPGKGQGPGSNNGKGGGKPK